MNCKKLLQIHPTILEMLLMLMLMLSYVVPSVNGTGSGSGSSSGGTHDEALQDDDVQWTNINEEVDMALNMIWPTIQEKGYTKLSLPDITESLSLRPLFITYSARLWLTNGQLYNLKDIGRAGDAMMTYNNKSFQFRANLVIGSVEFDYDFKVAVIGIPVRGRVGGIVKNVLVTGDFSVAIETTDISLNDFRIVSFGSMEIQLKHNVIIKHLSGSFSTPITNLFKHQITTTISASIKDQLEYLIEDINENDRLQLKQFGKSILGGFIKA